MKKILSLTIFIVSILIISGCGTTKSGTSSNKQSESIDLVEAVSDETYNEVIPFRSGTICSLVGATSIGGTLSLSNACVISGTAPHADETTIIPVKIEAKYSDGTALVLDFTLTVNPAPITLDLPSRIEANLGEVFEYNFCKPKPGMNCGEGSTTPTGGNPPYTFTSSGHPMGLIISLNGDLKGTIPELATPGDYSTEVCVKDTKGASDCGNTIIEIKDEAELEGDWTGTILTTRSYKHYSPRFKEDYNVEIVGKADFSFTFASNYDKYYAINPQGTGNLQFTTTITGPCSEEFVENFDLKIKPSFVTEKDIRYMVEESDIYGDIPLSIEDKINLDIAATQDDKYHSIIWIKFKCPDEWGEETRFNYDFDVSAIFLTAKDGAITEETLKDSDLNVPIKRITEIHKVN